MKNFKITKGLDIPLSGIPVQSAPEMREVEHHALLGGDYPGLKPRLSVKEGDKVKRGTPLFRHKDDPAINYGSPVAGTVVAINRGHRRSLVSVVVAKDDKNSQEKFEGIKNIKPSSVSADKLAKILQESGLWIAFRNRPFNKVPHSSQRPDTIFINTMAVDYHSPDPELFLEHHNEEFNKGVLALAALAKRQVFICCAPTSSLAKSEYKSKNVTTATFSGKFPASLSGTHMHFLYPASRQATNFCINYQDVSALGGLLTKGELFNHRMLGLSGPAVNNPRLIISMLGAGIKEIVAEGDDIHDGDNRLISGSVLTGTALKGEEDSFLGRYDLQITALDRGTKREFMGWISPGLNKFSQQRIYLSSLLKPKLFPLSSTTNGSERAMVPMSTYEKIIPHNMLATQLLRSLLVGDIEQAERLGCLELAEEDLALCSFVCPGKYEYGEALRRNLTRIEKENWDA